MRDLEKTMRGVRLVETIKTIYYVRKQPAIFQAESKKRWRTD